MKGKESQIRSSTRGNPSCKGRREVKSGSDGKKKYAKVKMFGRAVDVGEVKLQR